MTQTVLDHPTAGAPRERPTGPRTRLAGFGYRPELDGIRALAVVSVLLYHGGVWWAAGGFLGVDLFFVLSGYLITTLLLVERDEHGGIGLRAFWGRRARRLMPALLAVLIWVAFYAAFYADPAQLTTIRWDGVASLFYVANWRFVVSGASYFEQFLDPSPLRHMWSLAIEEQWYLVWPPVVLLGLRRMRDPRLWAGVLTAVAVASAGLMAILYEPGSDPSRVYYGTDTRAQALLLGAALAFLLRCGPALARPVVQRALLVVGLVGTLAVLAFLFVLADDQAAWMYRGGFGVFALAATALIGGTVQPGTNPLARVLALPPLPAIGRVSYGLYLWHWPVYVLLTPERTGISGDPLLALRLAVTAGVSVASYHLLENPIRRGTRLGERALRPAALSVAAVLAVLMLGTTAGGTSTGVQGGNEDVIAAEGDLRVLVVGDSVAWGLASAFDRAAHPGVTVRNAAMIGCGVVGGSYVPSSGVSMEESFGCDERPERWSAAVDAFDPQLTLVFAGPYEIFDHRVDGELLRFGTPAFESFLRRELQAAIDQLSSRGGRVVFVTSPCWQPKPNAAGGQGAPERRDPRRPAWINEVVRSEAQKDRRASVVELAGYVCPDGELRTELEGVETYRDGVHYSDEAAPVVWRWIVPRLQDIAAGRPPRS